MKNNLRHYLLILWLGFVPTIMAQLLPYPIDTINGTAVYRYSVEKSIGLFRISKNFGITQEEIIQWNPQLEKRGLRFEEELLIPVKQKLVSTTQVDVVPSVPLVVESTIRDNVSEDLPWEKEGESHELDSVVVAKALQWMASMHDIHLNGSQIQSILYNAYGVWLATKGERLLSEHPQVWQYGPVFPRAYKHLKKNVGTGEVEYDMLQADHPSEFVFVTKCFPRFAWTSASALSCPHTASGSPWKRSLDANPEKLGSRIDDELIREWFLPRV